MLDTSCFDEVFPEQERAQLKEQERIKQELELAKKRSVRVTIDLLGRQACCSPLLCFFVALKVLLVFSPLDNMHYTTPLGMPGMSREWQLSSVCVQSFTPIRPAVQEKGVLGVLMIQNNIVVMRSNSLADVALQDRHTWVIWRWSLGTYSEHRHQTLEQLGRSLQVHRAWLEMAADEGCHHAGHHGGSCCRSKCHEHRKFPAGSFCRRRSCCRDSSS